MSASATEGGHNKHGSVRSSFITKEFCEKTSLRQTITTTVMLITFLLLYNFLIPRIISLQGMKI